MPKRDSERRSFNSDKAAKARYLLGVGSLEQALLLAEQGTSPHFHPYPPSPPFFGRNDGGFPNWLEAAFHAI